MAVFVRLGSGKVAVSAFSDPNGYGVALVDTGKAHPIGEFCDEYVGEHIPQPGEVFIHCTNRESALVLMEQVSLVLAAFNKEHVDAIANFKSGFQKSTQAKSGSDSQRESEKS